MSFVLLIAVGIFILFRLVRDDVRVGNTNREFAIKKNIENIITLNQSVNSKAAAEFVERKEEILPELQGELLYVLGSNWREILESVPCPHSSRLERRSCEANVWEIPYRIWLAKQGYQRTYDTDLSSFDVSYCKGINYRIYKTARAYDGIRSVDDIIADQSEEKKYYKELGIRLSKVIEVCMREKHPELNLHLAVHGSETYAYWDYKYRDYKGMLYPDVKYLWVTSEVRREINEARRMASALQLEEGKSI